MICSVGCILFVLFAMIYTVNQSAHSYDINSTPQLLVFILSMPVEFFFFKYTIMKCFNIINDGLNYLAIGKQYSNQNVKYLLKNCSLWLELNYLLNKNETNTLFDIWLYQNIFELLIFLKIRNGASISKCPVRYIKQHK